MRIRIMIADDHTMFREGLKSLLQPDDEIEVVAEAEDGEICLEKMKETEIDILLLDIMMPRKNGLQVLEEVRIQNPEVKVLIVTGHDEPEYLMWSVDHGAIGYVLKESGAEELKKAIHMIIQGQTYIQPRLLSVLQAKQIEKSEDERRIEHLTNRELEVLRLLAVGMYNKEIAEDLHISERTVKNHVSNIFKKLDVADRTQAAVFTIRNNLIKL